VDGVEAKKSEMESDRPLTLAAIAREVRRARVEAEQKPEAGFLVSTKEHNSWHVPLDVAVVGIHGTITAAQVLAWKKDSEEMARFRNEAMRSGTGVTIADQLELYDAAGKRITVTAPQIRTALALSALITKAEKKVPSLSWEYNAETGNINCIVPLHKGGSTIHAALAAARAKGEI